MLERARQSVRRLFKREQPAPQQTETQEIIAASKNIIINIPLMLRLKEVSRDPFDPFSLGLVGKSLLDTFIMEQSAETRMTRNNTSPDTKTAVREHYAKSAALIAEGLGVNDVFLQAQCISPLREMASLLLYTYSSVGQIRDQIPDRYGNVDYVREVEREQAIESCREYARQYRTMRSKFMGSASMIS